MSLLPSVLPGQRIDPARIQRVLIVKLTSLGDVVHALPAAVRLKKAFPGWKLHWVAEDRCAPVLEGHPLIDSLIVYPRREMTSLLGRGKRWEALRKLGQVRRELAGLGCDLSIDLQGLAKSGLMVMMAGAPVRIGCTGLKELSYLVSRSVPEGRGLHAVDRNLKVAEFLGAPPGPVEFALGLRLEEKAWAREFLRGQGLREGERLVGFQVGASFPQKRWPVPKWISLIEQTARLKGVRIVLFGDQGDQERFSPFRKSLPGNVVDTLGGLTLRRLMSLIQSCRLMVGADTGPLHLAVGFGLPVVGLYGADDPASTGPYGNRHKIHYRKLDCSPCYKSPRCGGRFDCLEAIGVEEVKESLLEILEGQKDLV